MQIPNAKRSQWKWVFWTIGIALTLYLSLTVGAYLFVKYQRGVERINYLDIALPSNWARYQVKRGDHHIAQALHDLRSGNLAQGLYQLRIGLARAPRNREGRLVLAQLFTEINRPDLTRTTLLDGLDYHRHNATYVATTLRFILDQEDDIFTLTLSDQLLAVYPPGTELHGIATLSASTACFYQGNYDQAETYITAHRLGKSREGQFLLAQIEWERGYREIALLLLRNLHRKYPSAEDIYAQLEDYLRINGLDEEARRLAVLHQLAFPDRPRSHIDQLYALETEDNEAAIAQAAKRMIHIFANNQAGLLALGDFAASTGRTDLARALLSHFHHNNLPGNTTIQLFVIEALLVSERYREALDEAEALIQAHATSENSSHRNVAIGLKAIAQYGLGDPGAGYVSITSLMAQSHLRPDSLLAISHRMTKMGYRDIAREILIQAFKLSPRSQPILTSLVRMDLDNKNITSLTSNLRTLLTMRKPARDVMIKTRKLLSSDAHLFLPSRSGLVKTIDASLQRHQAVLTP